MSKIRNKNFISVKEKLEFIQKECKEPELFEDIKQLFKSKGFENVKINHGNREFGKDLIFSKYYEDFKEERWFSVIVKNKSATQNDFLQGHEIGDQINLSFTKPYKDIIGNEKPISEVIVIINGKVSDNATEVVKDYLQPVLLSHLKVWDYQRLDDEITYNCQEFFLNNLQPYVNLFIQEQSKKLSDISHANSVYDLNIDDINDIFINVQTTYSKEIRRINEYVTFENEEDKYKKEDIEGSNEILNSNQHFIIHGIPTSGKSIFLKRIGLKALNEKKLENNAVFFFDFQNFKEKSVNFNTLINLQYSELSKGEEFNADDYQKIVILIDSIDFINDITIREIIYKSIENFVLSDNNSISIKSQFVIATRDIEFIKNRSLLNNFKNTELLPFNFSQALSLVKKIIPHNQDKTNSFIKALKNNLLDTSLQRTPLALTLMAILYRDDKIDLKELPANIYELYNRFTDVYLDKWDTSKGVSQLYKYEQTKTILGFIAMHLHIVGTNIISEDDLILFLNNLTKRYNFEELESIESFIEHLKSKNGVFNFDKTNETFYFFNHYFQEFFASLSIESDESKILIDNFYDKWWQNAIVFYCGKQYKSFQFHKEIIANIFPLDFEQKIGYLSQHSKCLQASHAISIEGRTNVVSKLLKEFDNLINFLFKEAETNEKSFFKNLPLVNIINYSKDIFENCFSSKHISKKEILEMFDLILLEEKSLNKITTYNIAYFLAFHKKCSYSLEIFSNIIDEDVIWNRILYVDINFLRLKSKLPEKTFLRIKRKMNKNKFLIQYKLNETIKERQEKENPAS